MIIAFKNEKENLKKAIPSLLDQDYPEFELIFINDHSEDGGEEIIAMNSDDRMKLFHLSDKAGKKAALEFGISKANHDLLLFTDADCIPASNQWVKRMCSPLIQAFEISLGYGAFYRSTGLLNKLQRYENAINCLQNFSYLKSGRAYTAVGRNLAYKKNVFEKSSSFKKYGRLRSGDDDLLVNEMSEANNTIAVIDQQAFTYSHSVQSWKSYFLQKRRQLEAGRYYRAKDRLRLASLGISQISFNTIFIILLVQGNELALILTIFVLKIVLQILFYASPMKRLGESDVGVLSPFLEIIYLPLISLIGLSQYLWRVDRWK